MLPVALDFRDEVDELHAFLQTLKPEDWKRETGFMQWTPWDVVAHLHYFDHVSMVALEGAGLGRADFLLERSTGEFWVNEVNSLPGFTEVSMFPRLWEASGLPFPTLLDRLVELALERHRESEALETLYRRS